MAGKNDKYTARNKRHYDDINIRVHKSKNINDLLTRARNKADVSKAQFVSDAIEMYAATFGVYPAPLSREEYLARDGIEDTKAAADQSADGDTPDET